ncbi:hypothetical protein ABTC85_15400 [Acinetobacter baumannii]|uniref:Uncharacterized protein n=2 Tax=Acinetobacter baumannii TaxID=470 RepID=A0A0C4Y2J7_ACIBA|nr:MULTISPECIES: hypothetical protein [Acinetobacter calcoaceticus/baumannii complex]AFI97476.1 hypothetical protein ABTJ_p0098 [Acinetobacter baumannii MDR-TJ]AGQ12270.1 hypothetical protein BJAB0868_p0013 [Acinetobacter baumannii BJAB0868]AGQ16131.1 hypothetical protein BJAB07104_p0003 [Acinetobacter baumannii BJAB07104]AJF79839.1 hypothetical protein NG19_003 [Acinetobacter baumannii]APF45736.1 hypothetical protein BKJ37_19560 [Acinetobacter baumannii]
MLVTQYLPDLDKIKSKRSSEAPFRYWLENILKRSDKLPRGKFFKGKVGGKPLRIIDEYWMTRDFDMELSIFAKPRYGLGLINIDSENSQT